MRRILILFFAALLVVASEAKAADIELTVGRTTIDMNLFYNGASVPVTGSVPEGSQVLVRFIGHVGEQAMKLKGKAMGLLWMNKDTLHFSNMPAVCLVESSAPLADLGQAGARLGLAGVAESVVIEPASADRHMLLPELLKLKESEKLYREDAGAVRLEAAKNGRQAFSASIGVPSRLSHGDYSVEVFAIKDGQIVAQEVKHITAQLVGVPAFMAKLAFEHSLWYGIFAAAIAILAGFAVGMIFRGKGGAH